VGTIKEWAAEAAVALTVALAGTQQVTDITADKLRLDKMEAQHREALEVQVLTWQILLFPLMLVLGDLVAI
jgi:hypothetical protein